MDMEGLYRHLTARLDDALTQAEMHEADGIPDTYRCGYDVGYYHALAAIYDIIPDWART